MLVYPFVDSEIQALLAHCVDLKRTSGQLLLVLVGCDIRPGRADLRPFGDGTVSDGDIVLIARP